MKDEKKEKKTPQNPPEDLTSDSKDLKDNKDSKDNKDLKDSKSSKDSKDPVDPKDIQIQTLSAQKQHFKTNDGKKAIKIEELKEENLKLQQELNKKSSTLSDSDLIKLNPDYETMSDEERAEYREKIETKRRLVILEAKDKMRQDFAALPEDIRQQLESKGGFEVFKDYACSPDNVGQKNLLNLARSFLYENKEVDPNPETVDPESEPRPGLEDSGGGGETSPAPEGIVKTAEEIKAIRNKDPQEYIRLSKSGKLKIEG